MTQRRTKMTYKVYVNTKNEELNWIFDNNNGIWINEHQQEIRPVALKTSDWLLYETNDWNTVLSFIGKNTLFNKDFKSFSEILPALKKGRSAKRHGWCVEMRLEGKFFKFKDPNDIRFGVACDLQDKDVLANDWELCPIEETKKEVECPKKGMTFEEILPALKKGQAIKRKVWGVTLRLEDNKYAFYDFTPQGKKETEIYIGISPEDLLANDWELLEFDFHQLNVRFETFKIYQITTNMEPENETIFDCKRSMPIRFEDLVGFFADWEKLVKYAQTLKGKIKAKCQFSFENEKTYQVFHMLLEGSNFKNSCHFMDYRVDNKGYKKQECLIQFSFTILLSGGK